MKDKQKLIFCKLNWQWDLADNSLLDIDLCIFLGGGC